jgi:hypothetical protein
MIQFKPNAADNLDKKRQLFGSELIRMFGLDLVSVIRAAAINDYYTAQEITISSNHVPGGRIHHNHVSWMQVVVFRDVH